MASHPRRKLVVCVSMRRGSRSECSFREQRYEETLGKASLSNERLASRTWLTLLGHCMVTVKGARESPKYCSRSIVSNENVHSKQEGGECTAFLLSLIRKKKKEEGETKGKEVTHVNRRFSNNHHSLLCLHCVR